MKGRKTGDGRRETMLLVPTPSVFRLPSTGLLPGGHLGKNTATFGAKKGEGMSVEEKVKSIIVEQLGVDANEVTPDASFVDDLGADSLDTVELVMAFEEAFNIEIPDEAAEKIQKVKDAIAYIEKNSAHN